MVRLKDVAKLAGVSTATVSNVTRGTRATTPEVRRRVLDAIEQLGYVPNRLAQSLRTGRSRSIGLIVPDLANPYFPALIQAIEATARLRGYALIVMEAGATPESEHDALQIMASNQVAGLIWVPAHEPLRLDWSFPIVTVDRPLPTCDAVLADHRRGGEILARYVVDMGHVRVGLLSGPHAVASAVLRRQGFVDAAGDDLEIVWEHEVAFSSDLPEAVRERVRRPDVTLIACANDAIAVGALRALRQGGLHVPQDVSLVGFDDVPWAETIEPALTTVRQPLAELGSAAVEALHDRITQPDRPLRYETYPVEIVERRSVAALRPRTERRENPDRSGTEARPAQGSPEAEAEGGAAAPGTAVRQRVRVARR